MEVEELLSQPLPEVLHHTKPDCTPYPREECPIYTVFTFPKPIVVGHHVECLETITAGPTGKLLDRGRVALAGGGRRP